MSAQMVVEYLLNATWQVPLVAGAAWLLLRLYRVGAAAEHRVWLLVLAVCVVLPASGVEPGARTIVAGGEGIVAKAPLTHPRADGRYDSAAVSVPQLQPQPQPEPQSQGGSARWRARVQPLQLSARVVSGIAWSYAAVVGLALIRLVMGWHGAHRLVCDSTAYAIEEAQDEAWQQLAAQMNVPLPALRWSMSVRSPLLVGIRKPVIMLPFDFWRCSRSEQRAAISHELAHLRRRDPAVNALCQVAFLPLAWHPAAHGVSRQVSNTREMACDEMAARMMRSEVVYARSLLGLAQRMLGVGQDGFEAHGLGLFRSNKLEERVMKLTEMKREWTGREMWLRRGAGSLALCGALVAAGSFHLSPVMAQQAVEPVPTAAPVPAPVTASPVAPPVAEAVPAPVAPAEVAPTAPVQPVPLAGSLMPVPAVPALPAAEPLAPLAPSAPPAQMAPAMTDPVPPLPALRGNVEVGEGRYEHRWVGANGRTFEVWNDQQADLSAEARKKIEADVRREMENASREMARAQKEVAEAHARVNSPEFKAQMEQMKKDVEGARIDMAKAQKQMAEQMAKVNSADLKAQMDRMNSPEFKAQMEKFNSPEYREQMKKLAEMSASKEMARLNSPEFKRQIDDAMRQASSVDVQKRIAEAQKQVAEAMKQLEEAQKPLQ